jgi:hypothetical protein
MTINMIVPNAVVETTQSAVGGIGYRIVEVVTRPMGQGVKNCGHHSSGG